MGSEICIHLGPYMLVSKQKIKKEEVRLVCVNSDCSQFEIEMKSPFCQQCGQKARHKTFEIEAEKNIHEILSEQFEDELVCAHEGGCEISEEYDVLLPNVHVPDGLKTNEYGANVLAIEPDRMERELDWFKKEYIELIRVIMKEYGEQSITIKWGLVIHYN